MSGGPPEHVLAAIASGLAVTVAAGQLPLDTGQARRFTRLIDTPTYEAWLIAWSPSGSLELHDHGGSTGAVHVVEGELVETYTDLALRHPLRSRTLLSGDSLTVPARRVHEVWNPGPGAALSVHVYAPKLVSMTFFDHRSGHFLEPLRTDRAEAEVLV